MKNMLVNLAVAHKDFFIGAAVAYALGHVPEAVAFCFHQAMRVPFLRAAVTADPAKAKALIDQIAAELDKDIDQEASAPPPPAPQA